MTVSMDFTKESLKRVTFRTKGKWYRAEQVDAFIDELIVCAEETRRREDAMKAHIAKLEARLRDCEKKASVAAKTPAENAELLQKEQQRLIANIKKLRRLREEFKKAVAEDAAALTGKLNDLESQKLL